MEQIKLARLAGAAAPYLIDKPYTYTVPDALEPVLERGMRVLVPFGRGNRTSEAMVLSIENGAKRRGLKAIASILDDAPVLDAAGIRMALWMRERYFCTMYDAVRTILPTGLWFRTQTVYYLCDGEQREQAVKQQREHHVHRMFSFYFHPLSRPLFIRRAAPGHHQDGGADIAADGLIIDDIGFVIDDQAVMLLKIGDVRGIGPLDGVAVDQGFLDCPLHRSLLLLLRGTGQETKTVKKQGCRRQDNKQR